MELSPPDAASVAGTLAAINASSEFARSPVMRHLLGYLVNETLSGRGDRLKAYSVAVDALGRSADFDAQTDSYPRVQVGRLRRMLDTFYTTDSDVPLRLTIPLGAYRVQFDARGAEAANPLPPEWQAADEGTALHTPFPIVRWIVILIAITAAAALIWAIWRHSDRPAPTAIVPPPTVSIESSDAVQSPAERARIADVTQRIGTAFTRSGVATVVYGGVAVDARYALLLDMGTDGVSLSFRLIDRRSGTLEWGDVAALPDDPKSLGGAIEPYISTLVRPSGVIAARQRNEFTGDFRPGYPCLLHYDAYFRERTPGLRTPVTACLVRTLALQPNHAGALSAASFMMVDPVTAPISSTARNRGLSFARRAAVADPYSPAALIAEARIAFMEGNCTRGSALSNRAVGVGGHDPEILGLAGLLLVQCDRPRALALLRAARALDPDLTTFYVSALVLLELEGGDAAAAGVIADAMRPPSAGMMRQYLVAQILGEIAMRRNDRAQAMWRDLVARTPAPRGTIDAVLHHIYLAPDYRAMLAERLRTGGIDDEVGRPAG